MLQSEQILSPDEGHVAEVINREGRGRICLVCEHASDTIPRSLGTLDLSPKHRQSHAVWDIGAARLAEEMATKLDAPLYKARFSRLVYDLNRPPTRHDAMTDQSELVAIPGNRDLSDAHRAARTREFYEPFHDELSEFLDGFATPPALVTVHSFAPNWFGAQRETEIGLLHDADPTLALAMLDHADTEFRVELNRPYSASDGVTHMLARHGVTRHLPNVMIEVRNDLLSSDVDIAKMADALSRMVTKALEDGAGSA